MYLTLILALRLITDVISTEYLAPAFFHKLLLWKWPVLNGLLHTLALQQTQQ